MRHILLLILFLFPLQAQANGAGALCMMYQMPDDVETHGADDGVVPADIGGGMGGNAFGFLGQPIEIPIELDIIKQFAPDLPVGTQNALNLQPTVGFVKVYPDGKVEINGQDISGAAREYCANNPPSTSSITINEPGFQMPNLGEVLQGGSQ